MVKEFSTVARGERGALKELDTLKDREIPMTVHLSVLDDGDFKQAGMTAICEFVEQWVQRHGKTQRRRSRIEIKQAYQADHHAGAIPSRHTLRGLCPSFRASHAKEIGMATSYLSDSTQDGQRGGDAAFALRVGRRHLLSPRDRTAGWPTSLGGGGAEEARARCPAP